MNVRGQSPVQWVTIMRECVIFLPGQDSVSDGIFHSDIDYSSQLCTGQQHSTCSPHCSLQDSHESHQVVANREMSFVNNSMKFYLLISHHFHAILELINRLFCLLSFGQLLMQTPLLQLFVLGCWVRSVYFHRSGLCHTLPMLPTAAHCCPLLNTLKLASHPLFCPDNGGSSGIWN